MTVLNTLQDSILWNLHIQKEYFEGQIYFCVALMRIKPSYLEPLLLSIQPKPYYFPFLNDVFNTF